MRDLPLHVDFMRLGEGATIRVNIPIHVRNADQSPGVKRGGTVSIVTHTIEVRCRADAIPTGIEVDVGELDINHSKHLSDIKLPEGVRVVSGRDITLVTVVPPSGYAEEIKAAAEAAAAAAPLPPPPLPPPRLPKAARAAPHRVRRLAPRRVQRPPAGGAPTRSEVAAALAARDDADAAPGRTWQSGSSAMSATGTISASWRFRTSPSATASGRGAGAFRALPARGRSAASARCCCCPAHS